MDNFISSSAPVGLYSEIYTLMEHMVRKNNIVVVIWISHEKEIPIIFLDFGDTTEGGNFSLLKELGALVDNYNRGSKNFCYSDPSNKKHMIIMGLSIRSESNLSVLKDTLSSFMVDAFIDIIFVIRKYFSSFIFTIVIILNDCDRVIRNLLYKALEYKNQIDIYFLSPKILRRILLKKKLRNVSKEIFSNIKIKPALINTLIDLINSIKKSSGKTTVDLKPIINEIDNNSSTINTHLVSHTFKTERGVGSFEENLEEEVFQDSIQPSINLEGEDSIRIMSRENNIGNNCFKVTNKFFNYFTVGEKLILISDLFSPNKVALIPLNLLLWLQNKFKLMPTEKTGN